MSSISDKTGQFLDDILKAAVDSRGPNQLCDAPCAGQTVRGIGDAGGQCLFACPALEVSHTADAGNHYEITIDKDYKKDRLFLRCSFRLVPDVKDSDAVALRLFDPVVNMVMGSGQKLTRKRLDTSILSRSPQTATCKAFLTLTEFKYLTDNLSKGDVRFEWEGDVRWYDVSDPAILAKLNAREETVAYKTLRVRGTTEDILIEKDNPTTFGAVNGAMDWQVERLGDDKIVWFKDTMIRGTYYMLPQNYWIRANSHNRPSVKAVFPKGTEDVDITTQPIRYQFEISPYYHPGAERDLYNIVTKRSGGAMKYCRLTHGGYSSIAFEWDPDFVLRFQELGVNLSQVGRLDTLPGSSFTLSLDVNPTSIEFFNETLKSGVTVGWMAFEQGRIKVDVVLNIHRLAQPHLDVRVKDRARKSIPFPYEAVISNLGDVGFEVRDCKVSILSERKGAVKDAVHDLTVTTTWPVLLPGNGSHTVTLSPGTIEMLKGRSRLLGFIPCKRWTRLVCEPCSIYLCEDDADAFFSQEFYASAYSRKGQWIVEAELSLSPSPLRKVSEVEVAFRTGEGDVPSVILSAAKPSRKVTMSKTLNYILFPQLRSYTYRFRVNTGTGFGEWSEWAEGPAEGSLRLYDDLVKPFIK